jgi:hypothetical protein
MSAKKILITGIGVDATEQGIRALLGQFGPVDQIEIICEGNPHEPVALAEMDLSDGQAFHLTQRITDYWHEDAVLSAHLLMH